MNDDNKTIDLDDLVGFKKLDAVDFSENKIKSSELYDASAQLCKFRLDGIVYLAVENPEDGYRSCLEDIYILDKDDVKNIFEPIDVECKINPNNPDCLLVIDVNTNKPVLEIGTDYTKDEYYPMFISDFNPGNMITNQDVKNDLQ